MGTRNRDRRTQPLCGAKTRDGDPCKLPAVTGRTRCRMHGGSTPRGPASATYKDGKHSNVLPARMREDYERAISDEDLVSLRNEIAIVDARIIDLLKRVDSGESGKRWKEIQAQMKLVNSCQPEERMNELDTLNKLIRAGAADAYVWDEIQGFLLTREKLVRSERKRLVEARLVISLEQAQLLMAMFVDAAREAVGHDDKAMSKIVDAFARLTGHTTALEATVST